MNILTNREWAIVIWTLILVIYPLITPKIRETAKSCISCFFSKPLMKVWCAMIIYTITIVYILFHWHIWDFTQTKSTIIWFFAVGFPYIFKIDAIKDRSTSFKELALENFKLAVIVEFVVGFYPFGILVELVLVPLAILLTVATAASKSNENYRALHKFSNSLTTLLGFVIMFHVIYMMVTNFDNFATKQTLLDFAIPLLLTLLFLPFVFLTAVYVAYEEAFMQINLLIKNPCLNWVTKICSFLLFNLNIHRLRRWLIILHISDLTSKGGIYNSFKKIFRIRKLEKTRGNIPIQDGWSPYVAKDFLINEGIKTRDYNPLYEEEWLSCSNMISLDEGLPSNNIAYYVQGSDLAAKSLKLILNVNNRSESKNSHEKLLTLVKSLYEKATKISLPNDLENAVTDGIKWEKIYDNFKVVLSKEEWPSGNGYNINFAISNNKSSGV